ncbi:CBN-HEX-1 protein [Caenorhabditis brenneri]|uniref:Beta-hexosaminidase n=1 Tax=Caenorhabditis brenneri TaxID=135651 RepID=G0M7A3_CAEBE|nr:CBN-HEX-1 protein [Caenorhabditis brenneri]
MRLLILSLLFTSTLAWFYGRDEPDRWSVGGVWPLPQKIIYGSKNRTLTYDKIGIDLGDKKDCDILLSMADSYMNKWLFPFPVEMKTGGTEDFIITVTVKEECPGGPPVHGASEEYLLRVSLSEAVINAQTVWGALRAMETLSQLVFYDQKSQEYQIRTAEIFDKPRFPVRGIMIDSSRHFLSVNVIKRQLEIMSMNKLNVLHWHLVDSESFPYTSVKFPELHGVGAYTARHVYSREDIADIIAFARLRGIRVIPEFDLPGHTSSWRGRKGFLTECFDEKGEETFLPNLVDPMNEANFDFISEFLEEVTETFPDQFLHLGGDEVSDYIVECWVRNKKIRKFMEEKGFGNDTVLLENYFFEKLYAIVEKLKLKRKPIFWQEVFDNNIPDPNSVIHIWKGNTHEEIYEQVKNITSQNFPVIVSACWYLNYIKYGADWRDEIKGTAPSNSRPRASAAAERLWSPAEKTQRAEDAWPRMHELRCRLVSRGYRIQPNNNPDYCPFEFDEPPATKSEL